MDHGEEWVAAKKFARDSRAGICWFSYMCFLLCKCYELRKMLAIKQSMDLFLHPSWELVAPLSRDRKRTRQGRATVRYSPQK